MKRLNLAILSAVLLLLASACEKDRAFPEFKDLEYGAFARQLSRTGEFFLTDVDNSVVNVSVEFYDENQGRNVASYDWEVAYVDKATGANSKPRVALFSLPASSFTTNPDSGLPSVSFQIKLRDVLNKFGFTEADVNGGDQFAFYGTVVKTDGRRFGVENQEASLINNFPFAALFFFTGDLKCTSDIGGTLNYSTVPWCDGNATATGQVLMVETSKEGIYDIKNPATPNDPATADFSFGAYGICYGPTSALPGGNLQIKDVCNILSPIGASQWGETYWYNSVTVNGADLILDWENDYGEAGVTTLTRTDGKTWPPLRK